MVLHGRMRYHLADNCLVFVYSVYSAHSYHLALPFLDSPLLRLAFFVKFVFDVRKAGAGTGAGTGSQYSIFLEIWLIFEIRHDGHCSPCCSIKLFQLWRTIELVRRLLS